MTTKALASKDRKDRTILLWRLLKSAVSDRDRQRLKTEIYELNKGLLPNFVRRYTRFTRVRFDPDDIHQTAAMAMMRSLEDFDPAKGAFSTHVEWRVRKEIEQTLVDHLPIKIRGYGYPYKVWLKVEKFVSLHGRQPTGEEIEEKQKDLDKWAQESCIHFRGLQSKHKYDARARDAKEGETDIASQQGRPDELLSTAESLRDLNRLLGKLSREDRQAILEERAIPSVICRAREIFEDMWDEGLCDIPV